MKYEYQIIDVTEDNYYTTLNEYGAAEWYAWHIEVCNRGFRYEKCYLIHLRREILT